jgi:hypothetical protein
MAQVFQFVATGEDVPHADLSMIDGSWHVAEPIESRSLCGIQMDGDDGYAPGENKNGRVTCHHCRKIIETVQQIEDWR